MAQPYGSRKGTIGKVTCSGRFGVVFHKYCGVIHIGGEGGDTETIGTNDTTCSLLFPR
jgi:hypothetical protein